MMTWAEKVVAHRRALLAYTTGKLWCDRSLSWQVLAFLSRALRVTDPPWLPTVEGDLLADSTRGDQ
jgi:hypothetical protein